ncbi:MAG: hypothetical protein ON057_000015 [Glomeribacter sp. 1016415]|nr:hypothetical protein [Glomeribacter sp. 1016415]
MIVAAPLAATPPGLFVLGAVAAGVVAIGFYEKYKDRANNVEQSEEEDNNSLGLPSHMITAGRALHSSRIEQEDKKAQIEVVPNQSGEHRVKPLITPNQFGEYAVEPLTTPNKFEEHTVGPLITPNQSGEYTVEPLITPIAEALGKFGNVLFSENNNNNRKDPLDSVEHKYVLTSKHDKLGGWASIMDLNYSEAQRVLDNSIPSGRQRYGIHDGKIYEFQPDNTGGWHGKGTEAPVTILRQFLDQGKITQPEYKKLFKGKK